MSLTSWLKTKHTRRPVRRRPLWLEALEDRLSPAVVTTTLDNGDNTFPTLTDPTGPTPGSLREAIMLANEVGGGSISFNIPTTDPGYNPTTGVFTFTPPVAFPAMTGSMTIDGYTQGLGTPDPADDARPNTDPTGFNGVLKIELDGRAAPAAGGAQGLRFHAGGNEVRGLIINRFRGAGIFLGSVSGSGGSVVEGNILGTDRAGTPNIGNGGGNITIGDSDNLIGGTTPAARNIISGSSFHNFNNSGVVVTSVNGQDEFDTPYRNVIVGNFIGTDPSGRSALGQSHGVFIQQNARDTRVGGPTAAERNIISGNEGNGVLLANVFHQIVQGNYIGTDVTGTIAVPNAVVAGSGGGVTAGITGATGLIGGDGPGAGNLISGNLEGIVISNSQNLTIQGNSIGVTATGGPLGNRRNGINHGNGTNTLIGGTTAGAGNLIAFNGTVSTDAGIVLGGGGANVRIWGNEIRNNFADGIRASSTTGAPTKLIGGLASGERNTITANGLRGVFVQAGSGIEIAGNSIFNNTRLGIALGTAGLTPLPNDNNDPDGGPNLSQNYPILTSAVAGTATRIRGSLNSVAGGVYRLDFYASPTADPTNFGEGASYLGWFDVTLPTGVNTISFSGILPIVAPAGQVMTATATDASGNTSEFSRAIVIFAEPVPVNPIAGLTVFEDQAPILNYADLNHVFADADDSDGALTYTITAVTPQPFTPPSLVTAVIGPNDTLDLSFLANGHGTVDVTVSATDLRGHSGDYTFRVTVVPVADTPTVTDSTTSEDVQSSTGLVLSRNAVDGSEVTHFQITGITGGALFHNDGTTPIHDNDFITFAEGNAGLKFTPAADVNSPAGDAFRFQVQAATSDSSAGLGGGLATATITVSEVNDAPVGIDDELNTNQLFAGFDTSIPFAAPLANDTNGPANENGQSLTIIAVDDAVGGTVSLADGFVLFHPAPNYFGAPGFRYTLQDNGTTNGIDDFRTATAIVRFRDPQLTRVYVDDDWAGMAAGTDPDGPATFFGYDAFASIGHALDVVARGGRVSVAAGRYAEPLVISRDVTIEGAGARQTVVAGTTLGRAITVVAGASATVSGVAITEGNTPEGGGVLNAGTLGLNEVVVHHNVAVRGGGVANHGALTVTRSTIHDNAAFDLGGGVWNAGALTIINSTLSLNQATNAGGAIYMNGGLPSRVTHSTITTNVSAAGAGVAGVGSLELRSSIVAGNKTLTGDPADLFGVSPVSGGHNLIGSNGSTFQPAAGDLMGVDPRLGPLAANGGQTLTHALLRGSPAIDRGGFSDAGFFDQRGAARVEDGDGNRVKVIDIGSFEAYSPAITIVPLLGRVKRVDVGLPDPPLTEGDLETGNNLDKLQDFPDLYRYSAIINFANAPGPLIGNVVFEARRAGVVITHQELEPTADGYARVSYTNPQPGIDEVTVRATLGEFEAFDSDLVFWNPSDPDDRISVQQVPPDSNPQMKVQSGSRPRRVPTLTDQELRVNTAVGVNVAFYVFNNETGEALIVPPIGTSGGPSLTRTRSTEASEELVAVATYPGMQLYDNVGVQWVFAPPQLSVLTERISTNEVRVTATLTRDLGQDLDDSSNPPVMGHELHASIAEPTFGSIISPATGTTDANGQVVFTVTDQSLAPQLYTVSGVLRTGMPDEPEAGTAFSATGLIVDTLQVTIDPPSQSLPTRESVLGGLISAPNRAYINVKVEFGQPLPGVRVLFTIVSGPHADPTRPFVAVTGADGVARFSYLNQNEFDLGDGDGDPGTDRFAITLEGADEPVGYAEVRWEVSVVSGPQSTLAEWVLNPFIGLATKRKPWVHVEMEAYSGPNGETGAGAGPVMLRFIDPVAVGGGLTSFHEISPPALPAPPNGFATGDPVTGQPFRYYEIHSTVDPVTNAFPILVFIHKSDFPDGFDPDLGHKIFHAKDGQWEALDTFDGGYIAALDKAADFVFDLRPDVISNLISAGKAALDFAGHPYHDYWVAVTESLSPFAIFMPTGAVPIGNADAYAVVPNGTLHVTAANGVLVNDTDADSATAARLVDGPRRGTLQLHADGSFEYTPEPGLVGEVTFTYRPFDDVYEGVISRVTIFVTNNPLAATLALDSATIAEGDSATLTGSLTGPGTSGTHQVDIDWDSDGAFDQTMTLPPGVMSFSASRPYLDDGPAPGNGTPFDDYTVNVRVSDNSGNLAEAGTPLRVSNVAPTADAGADQSVPEGSLVTLHGSFADTGTLDTHTFHWHVTASNGQVIADGTGIDFTFTPEDNGTYTVTFTATDDDGESGSDTLLVTVENVAPTAAISGPASASVGQTISFVLTATDASVDQAANFTFAIDWDEDDAIDEVVTGPSGLVVTHNFAEAGAHEIAVTATDKDGAASEWATHLVQVDSVSGGSGTVVQNGSALVITGTDGHDVITVRRGRREDELVVRINGVKYGPFVGVATIRADGLAGKDRIQVGHRVTQSATLDGGAGNDFLRGGAGGDLLRGGDGNDELVAVTGDDTLEGGAGDDLLRAGEENDALFGGEGNDVLRGARGTDLLDGGEGDDELRGGTGNDDLRGGTGNDVLRGGAGNDQLDGGDGNDDLRGEDGDDVLLGSAGDDTLSGGAGNDLLRGEDGADCLDGDGGEDILLGGAGNDVMIGGAGRDLMIGGFGADALVGNTADDILIGGFTAYDSDPTALFQILSEWNGAGTYQNRVTALESNTFAFRLVADQTVFDDNAIDQLTGSAGSDWFFANVTGSGARDTITDLGGREEVEDLDP